MYRNYGDRDFYEYGILVDESASADSIFEMLLCRPYAALKRVGEGLRWSSSDTEDMYQFARVSVDISDSWIDKAAVMSYAGMCEEDFDPLHFAIACTDYYSWDNFGADYSRDWQHMTKADVRRELQGYLQPVEEMVDLSCFDDPFSED